MRELVSQKVRTAGWRRERGRKRPPSNKAPYPEKLAGRVPRRPGTPSCKPRSVSCHEQSARISSGTAIAYPSGALVNTLLTVVVGLGAGVVFMLWLHVRWVGVSPLGM